MDNDFKIVMTGHAQGRIYKDGQELKGVTSIEFSAKVGGENIIKIGYLASKVEISGPAEEIVNPAPIWFSEVMKDLFEKKR